MNNTKINGERLIEFSEHIGCNKRYEFNNNSVLWSIVTGNFFVIPNYPNEDLDSTTVKYIISEIGISEKDFFNLWKDYNDNHNEKLN